MGYFGINYILLKSLTITCVIFVKKDTDISDIFFYYNKKKIKDTA